MYSEISKIRTILTNKLAFAFERYLVLCELYSEFVII